MTEYEDDPFVAEDVGTAAPVPGEDGGQEGAAVAAPVPEDASPEADQSLEPAPQLDQVIDKLDKEDAAFLLKLLSRFGIDQGDPLVAGIHILLDTKAERAAALEAAAAAANAAGRIEKSTAGVGEDIYTQTIKAGNDLQGVITTALRGEVIKTGKGLLQAIQRAADSGAQKIETAAAGLDDAAHAQQAVTLRQWRADLAAAARHDSQARARTSWIGIALTVLLCVAIGAGLAVGAGILTGKVLPWGWRVTTPGAGDCGTVTTARGRGTVCLARRS
ncbi:MAG: hypothetical protein ACYDBH_02990 [Acidobacteriaceae bacterium]